HRFFRKNLYSGSLQRAKWGIDPCVSYWLSPLLSQQRLGSAAASAITRRPWRPRRSSSLSGTPTTWSLRRARRLNLLTLQLPTSVGVSSLAEVFLLGAKPALLTQPFAGTRNSGRILITDLIAGYTPGAFQAVYHGTKAFIDSFSYALRNELKDTDVTVTCLMPGATETEFF